MRRLGPPIALWLLVGAVLAAITGRIADWFVMTDELLYERLALSVDRLHSPIPHVHGEVIANLNQLYPLVLAPVFANGTVADGLHRAQVFGVGAPSAHVCCRLARAPAHSDVRSRGVGR